MVSVLLHNHWYLGDDGIAALLQVDDDLALLWPSFLGRGLVLIFPHGPSPNTSLSILQLVFSNLFTHIQVVHS